MFEAVGLLCYIYQNAMHCMQENCELIIAQQALVNLNGSNANGIGW